MYSNHLHGMIAVVELWRQIWSLLVDKRKHLGLFLTCDALIRYRKNKLLLNKLKWRKICVCIHGITRFSSTPSFLAASVVTLVNGKYEEKDLSFHSGSNQDNIPVSLPLSPLPSLTFPQNFHLGNVHQNAFQPEQGKPILHLIIKAPIPAFSLKEDSQRRILLLWQTGMKTYCFTVPTASLKWPQQSHMRKSHAAWKRKYHSPMLRSRANESPLPGRWMALAPLVSGWGHKTVHLADPLRWNHARFFI